MIAMSIKQPLRCIALIVVHSTASKETTWPLPTKVKTIQSYLQPTNIKLNFLQKVHTQSSSNIGTTKRDSLR